MTLYKLQLELSDTNHEELCVFFEFVNYSVSIHRTLNINADGWSEYVVIGTKDSLVELLTIFYGSVYDFEEIATPLASLSL